MIEKIIHEGKIIAIILYKNYHYEGISFLTEKEDPLQLGYMSHSKGHEIKPHIHKKLKRNTVGTHEALFIKSGRIKVDFYSYDRAYLKSKTLSGGDVVLLGECGHGFTILEDASIVEVKNGPYLECKERFVPKKDKIL